MGNKSVFIGKNLIIFERLRYGRFFGMYGFSYIEDVVRKLENILFGIRNGRFDADEAADELAQFFVEIVQKGIFFFVKRTEIVFVIFKKRRGVICRNDGVPMQVPPISVFGNADVFHRAFGRGGLFDGDAQRHRAVGSGNDAAVAVGLFLVVVVYFDNGFWGAEKERVIFDGGEVERSPPYSPEGKAPSNSPKGGGKSGL